ncbi:MAG: hypothetical protein Q4G25_08350 [Paracoccus sp. (in: a-proteobacteria)]|nr:hypothetical protein [Paracoccus sp. (in: a-proteobacteria)]
MLFAVLTGIALEASTPSENLIALQAEIDGLVLSGQRMPAAFLLELERLPDAAERMQVIVYLRRSGLMTGREVPLDRHVFRWPAAVPAVPVQGHADDG